MSETPRYVRYTKNNPPDVDPLPPRWGCLKTGFYLSLCVLGFAAAGAIKGLPIFIEQWKALPHHEVRSSQRLHPAPRRCLPVGVGHLSGMDTLRICEDHD